MRDQVLWRKTARIITILADRLSISQERAMDIFYNSHTFELFNDPESGLQLLGDEYIVNDVITELANRQ
ncbi:MAG: DUF3791 domain-containing protein [Muribaculaceae bacterium]|nr:DUF3791 domain-containing protein [Muribaculaceae bacterium]